MNFSFLAALLSSSFALGPPEPFDFIEDAILKYVNHSADPCENFYRHACPYSSPTPLINSSLKNVFEYLNHSQQKSYWNKLDVHNDFEKFQGELQTLEDPSSVVEFYTNVFKTVCEQRSDLLSEISDRISHMTVLRVEVETEKETKKKGKRTTNFEDEDCDSAAEEMRETIDNNLLSSNINTTEFGFLVMENVTELIKLAKGISYHLDVDVRQGIEETRKMVEATMKIAENLIKDTPWAKNQHVVETIENITSMLAIHDNYGKDFKVVTDTLFELERHYVDCKHKFQFIEKAGLFCFLATAKNFTFPDIDTDAFISYDNAFNSHPTLIFGYPNYYHSQYGREKSTKLGYTGTTVGHEIGHTFFDNHANLELLPYFSEVVETCVQNQFNVTCMEYEEDSCATTDEFLEENGADIFGFQLAYELLKNYYGVKIGDVIDRLQVTHEQAFFYAYAFSYCTGARSSIDQYEDGSYEGHSANNVRVNAVAQHPGFQEAFNCPSDSRMMKSATEQCHVYGKEAPETRRRKFKY